MPKAVETAVFGATLRQIVFPHGEPPCAATECKAEPNWVVYQEHYDGDGDDQWFSCDQHLASVAVDAIESDQDED